LLNRAVEAAKVEQLDSCWFRFLSIGYIVVDLVVCPSRQSFPSNLFPFHMLLKDSIIAYVLFRGDSLT